MSHTTPSNTHSRSSRSRGLRLCVALLALVVALGAGTLGALWIRMDHPQLALPAAPDGVRTWLIVGLDDRDQLPEGDDVFGGQDDAVTHADVIFLLRLDPAGPTLLSLPRGLTVLDGDRPMDLSRSYTRGPQQMVDLMCRALQVPVTDMATINMRGFVELVDAVGGVEVTLPNDLRDTHSHVELPAGTHTVDGDTALALVRSRQGQVRIDGQWVDDPEASLGRARRAEEVLTALTEELSQASWWTLGGAAWKVTPEVSISEGSNPLPLISAMGGLPDPVRVTGEQAIDPDKFLADDTTAQALQAAGFTSCAEADE
ncbi:MAG: LCP family protein [Arachnia sp.]